jgi:hypothetical protein
VELSGASDKTYKDEHRRLANAGFGRGLLGRRLTRLRSEGHAQGRKVFIVLYRNGGAGSQLRKYTIGPYGRVTLHQARLAAQKVFAAKLDGRDLVAEKRESKRSLVVDRFDLLLEKFIAQHLRQKRSGSEIARILRREFGDGWAETSVHAITKRDVVDVVTAIEQRGAQPQQTRR